MRVQNEAMYLCRETLEDTKKIFRRMQKLFKSDTPTIGLFPARSLENRKKWTNCFFPTQGIEN